MILERRPRSASACLAILVSVCVCSAPGVFAQSNPTEWIDRMSSVVGNTDYDGTVLRIQDGKTDTLKVFHRIVDGVVNEKLISQEGNGLEIIRIGNEVHCILPDRKSVLVEEWNNQSTLLSALPEPGAGYSAQYDVSLVREERVAGRKAVLIAIRPHDEFRYGHRVWLDSRHSFPLRTEVISVNGDVIEQIKFADIRFGGNVPDDILAPSVNIDSFTWYAEPSRYQVVSVDTQWVSDDLPQGFEAVSARKERKQDADESVTHIVYSDGLASVSVFVAENSDKNSAGPSRVGTSNSYSLQQDEYHITAVGKVPDTTVRRIAMSMRLE